MESSAEERLKMLQMADLGSARRERISTVDGQREHLEQARLQEIEAARLSNVAGTNAQRMAERNKSKLSEWANVYQKLGDAEDLEHLDNLLNGQTHRTQLSSTVRGNKGLDHAEEDRNVSSSLKAVGTAAEAAVSLRKGSQKGSQKGSRKGSGRGGGIVGSRSRASNTPSLSGKAKQGAVPEPKNHAVESPHKRTRGLDPALDEKQNDKSRSPPKKQGKKKGSQTKLRPRIVAPMPASPNDFLAIAREVVGNTNKASENPNLTTAQASSIASPGQEKQAQNTAEIYNVVVTKDAGSSPGQRSKKTTSRVSTESREEASAKKPIPDSASTADKNRTSAPSTPTSRISKTECRPEVTDLKSPGQNTPVLKINGATSSKKQLVHGLTSNHPQPIQSHKEQTTREHEEGKAETENVGMLLDFDPPSEGLASEKPSLAKEQTLLRNSVFEDLDGIDFSTQIFPDSSLPKTLFPEPASSPRKKLDFQEHARKNKDFPSNGPNYGREIAIIDNLIETMPLSKVFLYMLRDCKKELELRIRLAEMSPTDDRETFSEKPPQQTDEHQETSRPANTSTSEPSLIGAGVEGLKTVGQETERTTTQDHTEDGIRPGLSPHSSSFSGSQIQDTIAALPFYPKVSSFMEYRSTHSIPSVSSSSSSSSPPRIPSPVESASPAALRVVGNYQQLEQQHIFGHHLLPSRRAHHDDSPKHEKSPPPEDMQFSIPQRSMLSRPPPALEGNDGESESPSSSETEKVATTIVTLNPEVKHFTPISINPLESNLEISTTPTKAEQVVPSLTQDPTTATRTANPNDPRPLQQSIHAPKHSEQYLHEPSPTQRSTSSPKPSRQPGRSASSGLQNSIWANSENHKPLP